MLYYYLAAQWDVSLNFEPTIQMCECDPLTSRYLRQLASQDHPHHMIKQRLRFSRSCLRLAMLIYSGDQTARQARRELTQSLLLLRLLQIVTRCRHPPTPVARWSAHNTL